MSDVFRILPSTIPLPHTVRIADDSDFGVDDGFSNGQMLSDNGQAQAMVMGELNAEGILRSLTNRQSQVISLLADGMSRKEVASIRGVSLQSVHQIVLRIRKRVKDKKTL